MLTERTALVRPEEESSDDGRQLLTAWQLTSMTVLLAGIQFVWTVELGYGTPYLLSLGLSKPLMTLVWMAGPLSGLLIQPIVGRISDRCHSKLGRRRPFIIGGAAFVVASVVGIAYARELAGLIARSVLPPGNAEEHQAFAGRVAIVLAVVGFYVLDFSINTSQACARALALDLAPLRQQDAANAYAGRMLNLGSMAGYMVGFLDLRAVFPWRTDSQMQALCLIAVAVFVATVTWTSVSVREQPLLASEEAGGDEKWATVLAAIWRGVVRLPAPVQRVCNVQFFAWIAWFPFLFFATTWVIEIMARTGDINDPDFVEQATRAGSFALFLYALASLGFSLVLPAVGHGRLGLRGMWRLSLATMAGALLASYFVGSVAGATALIVAMAFPWALALWAPFALVGEFLAIQAEMASGSDGGDRLDSGSVLGIHNMYVVFPQFVINGISSLVFAWFGHSGGGGSPGIPPPPPPEARSVEFLAMSTLTSYVRLVGEGEPIGWVLRIGGASALVATGLTWFLYDRHGVRNYLTRNR